MPRRNQAGLGPGRKSPRTQNQGQPADAQTAALLKQTQDQQKASGITYANVSKALSQFPAAMRAKLRRRLFQPIDPTGQLGETSTDLLILVEATKPEAERVAAADRIWRRFRVLLYYGGRVEGDRVQGGRQAAKARRREHTEIKVRPWCEEYDRRRACGESSAAIIHSMAAHYSLTERYLRRKIQPRRR